LKKPHKRAFFWLFWLGVGLICEEGFLRGYWFKPSDVITPAITHEKFVAGFFVAALISWLVGEKGRHGQKKEFGGY